MTQLNTYLNFNGNTEDVFTFYQSVLGGEITELMRYADMPSDDNMPIPDDMKQNIMHIGLAIRDNCILMGSDSLESLCGGQPLIQGNNYTVAISPDSEADAKRIFDALSADGEIKMPLEPQFWGSLFGLCVDKFGVQWMVDFPIS